MIRIDALWLATTPIELRMGTERLLARVVQVFGSAQAHHGYLFANARGNRMKLLLHDGFGMWCAARRLNQDDSVKAPVNPLATSLHMAPSGFHLFVDGNVEAYISAEGTSRWRARLVRTRTVYANRCLQDDNFPKGHTGAMLSRQCWRRCFVNVNCV